MNPRYRISPQLVARAVVAAVVIAIPVAVLWGLLPAWSFWFAIGGAFAIAEGIVRVTGATRGSTYQLIGMAAVLLCIVLSRVLLANRLGVNVNDFVRALSTSRFDDFRTRLLFQRMALDLANFVYMALALAIPWVRFR